MKSIKKIMNIEINLYNFLLLFMFLCNFFHYFVVEGCNNGSGGYDNNNSGDGDDKNIIMKTISISTSTSTIGNSINMKQQESLSSLITNETKKMQQPQEQRETVSWSENVENDAGSKQILSRKRRYLSFPSGSSFQIGMSLDEIYLYFFALRINFSSIRSNYSYHQLNRHFHDWCNGCHCMGPPNWPSVQDSRTNFR